MAIDVRMPKLSDNMEEGTIIRWMKAPGDAITKGEPLAEVETDKADVELEASDSGVLREIKVAEGQSAAVGAVIAVLAGADESAGGDGQRAGARQEGEGAETARPAARTPSSDRAARAPERREPAEPREKPTPRLREPAPKARPAAPAAHRARPEPAAANDRTVRASPLAWRLADEAGVNLAELRGTGPGGRILKRDVEASIRGPAGVAAPGEAAPDEEEEHEPAAEAAPAGREAAGGKDARATRGEAPRTGRESEGEERRAGGRLVPASRMRLAIATRMADAKREIPHFYVGAELDMTEAMHLRESIKRREAMPGVTVTHLLLRALAIALVRHPRVNASWRGDAIELHDDVNIGIAVAVEDGLVVPVLHRAQTLSLGEVVTRAGALVDKARNGKFGGDDLTGGTFSISNVGMLSVDELVAVINPPQAAILAVAAVKDRPIVRDGQLAIAKTMRATLSCDHRVLNGVEGGRFLEELKSILENPVTLLLDDAAAASEGHDARGRDGQEGE